MRLVYDEHLFKGKCAVFEMRDDGNNLIAGIYSTQDGLKIISKYLPDSKLIAHDEDTLELKFK